MRWNIKIGFHYKRYPDSVLIDGKLVTHTDNFYCGTVMLYLTKQIIKLLDLIKLQDIVNGVHFGNKTSQTNISF